ncbi:MAG: four helix bundle protein [Bacteroidia bacterium]
MQKGNDNIILKSSFEFALKVIEYCDLLNEAKHWAISNQLLRSGTSIGANVKEAQNAESKADFIHKFKIAAKEAEETEYGLELCQQSKNYPDCQNLLIRIKEIQKILNKIISTSKLKNIG